MSTIICLMGPTATGKSDLALKLASRFPVEIVSVDSAMVYRGMDIGTAKPDQHTLKNIPHYLINICNPDETYSAGQFCEDAVKAIQTIHQHQCIPLLTGGTMLYFRALQKGLAELPKADIKIREKINREALQHGWPYLHEKLKAIDPVTAHRLHANDAQRIQRALEIYEITKMPLTEWHKKSQKHYLLGNTVINIGLMPEDREKLKEQIAQRFYVMLEKGFIEEVEKLLPYQDKPALQAVGYREVMGYLTGKYDKTEMIQKALAATRQLAKRQMTWLRSFPSVNFFKSDTSNLFEEVLHFLKAQKR